MDAGALDPFKKPIEKDDLVLWSTSAQEFIHAKVTHVRFVEKGFIKKPEHQVRLKHEKDKQTGWIPVRRILKLPLYAPKE